MTMELQVEPTQQSTSKPQPILVGSRPRFLKHGLLPAVVSGVLLWMCFFPLALGWLSWIALVPLLSLVRSKLRPRDVYVASWIGGLVFFWTVLQWMRVADFRMYFTWAMLATYCSFYFPVALFLIRRIDRSALVPLAISVPCVWVGLEYVRSFLLTGFSWYYLGHTQHDVLPVIQIADVTGVYGVSFLVAMVNAWLFTLLYQNARLRDLFGLRDGCRDFQVAAQGIIIFTLLAANFMYGLHRLGENDFTPGPRLAMLQGNLDQRLRNDASDPKSGKHTRSAVQQILQQYSQLCRVAMHNQQPRPNLLVWPETSFPTTWWEISDKVDLGKVPDERDRAAHVQDFVVGLGASFNQGEIDTRTDILFGMNAVYVDEDARQILYNSALMLRGTGQRGDWVRHDKMHRIPFGEYVPLEWLPFMKDLMPYDFPYSITPGKTFTRFDLADLRFGVLICYEDTDPFIARHYGRAEKDGPAVDFLVNISNDGWFDGTSEHEQHLAISRFRAIECRRALARAVNMGVSAVIDSNGRVLKPNTSEQFGLDDGDKSTTEAEEVIHSWLDRGAAPEGLPVSEWHAYKKTAGVLAMNIPIDRRTSWYAVWGDWLPMGCWVLVGAGLVLGFCCPAQACRKLTP